MFQLAAFADEISPDFDVQIEHCKKNGITHFELRSVAGKNVLDFDNTLRNEIKTRLDDNGLAVACIGSPIGKVKLDESFEAHFDRFKIAVELSEFFDAPFIRIFSYYPATGSTHDDFVKKNRSEVMRRLQCQVDYLDGVNRVLIHENEANIYGEKGAQCLDIHQTILSSKLKAAFDFANFVQAGEDPLKCWPLLKPHVVHFHIKDAIMGTGKVVPAGKGDGHIAEILKDAIAGGYKGFFSLEPHLSAHEQFSGFTGPALFQTAVESFRQICRESAITLI